MNFLSLSLCPVMFLVIGKCDTNSWSKLKLMISLLKTNFFFFSSPDWPQCLQPPEHWDYEAVRVFRLVCVLGGGLLTQGLVHSRQVLYHLAIFLAQRVFCLSEEFLIKLNLSCHR